MIAPIDLNQVRAFAAVYETGRFSTAGERLGVPRSTVSRAVAALEEATGLLLFQRTTRMVRPTAAGTALFERTASSLRTLESGLVDLPESDNVPSGVLRVTATPDLAIAILAEVATRFTERHPQTSVDFLLTPRVVDLAREGFDLALRVAPKRLESSSLVVRRVGSLSIQLYASPQYLARRGQPSSPADLARHEWVGLRGVQSLPLSSAKRTMEVDAVPRIFSDDMTMGRELVRMGAGICWLPSFLADPDVAEGRLVRVLPRWTAPTGSVYLVHPTRRHVPARVTAFRDLLLETLKRRPSGRL